MQQIRLHGRGGQGAVTSAELIAIAAINRGKFAQAFPSFGPERRGAPVVAFSRIDEKKISIRAKVYRPDIVIVLDPGLLSLIDPTDGMSDEGMLVVNTKKSPDELIEKFGFTCGITTIHANKIANEELGRPIVNPCMLGSFIKATGILDLEDIETPVLERFGDKLGPRNVKALKRAYEEAVSKR